MAKYDKEWWHNKHARCPVKYAGRFMPKSRKAIPTDITHFMRRGVVMQDHLIDCIGYDLPSRSEPDKQVHAIQAHVVEYLKYVRDKKSRGYKEFWQFANETKTVKKGDCEDGAFLIGCLILTAVAPEHRWRARFTAGSVKAAPTAPEGGHGYITWFRTTDNQPVVLDWCFHEDSRLPVCEKPVLKDRPEYLAPWFSCNSEYAYTNIPDLKVISGRLQSMVTV